MNNSWTAEAWRLVGVLAAGALAGLLTSHLWIAVAIALLAYVIWLQIHLYRLNRWIQKGLKLSEAPDVGGMLENIVTNIYQLKTSKKRGKKRLAKLLGQFRASAEALPDATVILTSTGEIQWFNEAAETLLGLQSPRDIGQRIDNLLRDPEFRRFLHASNRKDELRLPSVQNESIILAYRLINYGKEQQLLTVRDVSIRERVERVRREFVSNASHELRTPLTVIRGYLEVMAADKDCSKDVKKKMQLILDQTRRMENIVNEMLTLSRLENSLLDPEEGESIRVADVLQELAKQAQQSGRASTGQITVNADEKLCLRGVRTEIISVASNLMYNALQHNPKGTSVEMQWFTSGSGAPCLMVSDDGPGIEQQHLGRLTERFYRVDSGRSRDTGGTGLGLAIVKHIVQRHGGQIDISSSPPEGSSFTCCFAASRRIECNRRPG